MARVRAWLCLCLCVGASAVYVVRAPPVCSAACDRGITNEIYKTGKHCVCACSLSVCGCERWVPGCAVRYQEMESASAMISGAVAGRQARLQTQALDRSAQRVQATLPRRPSLPWPQNCAEVESKNKDWLEVLTLTPNPNT